jgi:hypothetical protein
LDTIKAALEAYPSEMGVQDGKMAVQRGRDCRSSFCFAGVQNQVLGGGEIGRGSAVWWVSKEGCPKKGALGVQAEDGGRLGR